MKKLLACILTVFTVGLFAQGLHWNLDFTKALDLSRKTGKPVFAFFTGSDWCGWCMKLDQEILSKREMISFLNDHFILFKADFPRRNQPPEHVMRANIKLQRNYEVGGYPTIIITDGKGSEIGRTGYVRGGPAAMKAQLSKYIRKTSAPTKQASPVNGPR